MSSAGRILVVDDDRLVLATVTHGLQQAGYEVFDADNGDEAILLAHQHRPDLALLDIRMEGKSGFDVATYLRDGPRIPFMFLSAFSDEKTREQARDLGAVDYLVKPIEVAQLVPRVRETLERLPGASAVPAAPVRTEIAAQPLDPLSLAVGVLMHRHGSSRLAALQRLQRMADEKGTSLAGQAERLLDALEELARSGG
jgi:two-component system, response regulator PdtaR